MIADLLTLYVYYACLAVVIALVLAAIIKWLAKPLAFIQAFYVSLAAAIVWLILFSVYTLARPSLGLIDTSYGGSIINSVLTIMSLCVMGSLITRLLRRYGVEKVGLLGIGAKAVFFLLILSWIASAALLFLKFS